MPYPQNMVKSVYEFDWGTTGEIQVTGFWGVVSQEGTANFGDWDEIAPAIAEKLVTSWATQMPKSYFSPQVKARRAICYHYDQALHEVLDRAEHAFDGTNVWAGSASESLPPQLSVVVSPYAYDPATYVQHRDSKRGRMYLPTPSAGILNGNGQLDQTQQDNFVNVTVALFNAITGALELEHGGVNDQTRYRPYIRSTKLLDAFKVTHVRCGQVVDTQERRRNKLPENYRQGTINV
jgi:hypothetical protein